MRILLAPDKFKGSLSASEAAEAIRAGLIAGGLDAEFQVMPIADGGEGTAEAVLMARGGSWLEKEAADPLGRRVSARYAWIDGTAVIEMCAASGYSRLAAHERDPLRASTFGTGELIRDATARGATEIVVGLGGSATNDAGAGMAAALGYEFLTSDGEPLTPIPQNLLALTCIKAPEHLALPKVTALCDVRNPLLGPRGASRVFGPQKGATEKTIPVLEAALGHLADLTAAYLGCDFRDTPGAGAAGGLGFGLLTFCNASIQPGFETLAAIAGLEEAIAASDLVVTGEGRLDAQTAEGKGPAGVAQFARAQGKPVVIFGGSITAPEVATEYFDAAFSLAGPACTVDDAIGAGAAILQRCACEAAPGLTQLASRRS